VSLSLHPNAWSLIGRAALVAAKITYQNMLSLPLTKSREFAASSGRSFRCLPVFGRDGLFPTDPDQLFFRLHKNFYSPVFLPAFRVVLSIGGFIGCDRRGFAATFNRDRWN
jgi:amino acid transporter